MGPMGPLPQSNPEGGPLLFGAEGAQASLLQLLQTLLVSLTHGTKKPRGVSAQNPIQDKETERPHVGGGRRGRGARMLFLGCGREVVQGFSGLCYFSRLPTSLSTFPSDSSPPAERAKTGGAAPWVRVGSARGHGVTLGSTRVVDREAPSLEVPRWL